MPILANDRHETYALCRAKGMKPPQAAIAAGFATGSAITSALEKDVDVVNRIREHQEEIKERKDQRRLAAQASAREIGSLTGKTKAWVVEQLALNAQQAREDGDYGASNNALKLIGEELNMFKGGSAGSEDGADGLPTYDMDVLETVLKPAQDALAAPIPEEVVSERIEPDALKLIEGHGAAAKRIRESRRLNTGSETDAALLQDEEDQHSAPDDMFDEDQPYDDAPETPQQDAEEIVYDDEGPELVYDDEDEDIVPPPRSRGRV